MLETKKVTMLPDGRMDTVNAAAYLGLAPKTIAIMRSEGTGPLFIKRGRVFYFKSDLDAWLQEAEKKNRCTDIVEEIA